MLLYWDTVSRDRLSQIGNSRPVHRPCEVLVISGSRTLYEMMELFTCITNAWDQFAYTHLQADIDIYELVVSNILHTFSLQLLCRPGPSHEARGRSDRDILVL